ncbi:MAG: hypothetical protein WAM42_08550 [Candidatus Nitrosopolaris sp.]
MIFPEENESVIPVRLGIDQYTAKLANIAKIGAEAERLAIEIAHKSNNHLLAHSKSPNALALLSDRLMYSTVKINSYITEGFVFKYS